MDKIGLMVHDIRLIPGNTTAVRHGDRLRKPVKRPLRYLLKERLGVDAIVRKSLKIESAVS